MSPTTWAHEWHDVALGSSISIKKQFDRLYMDILAPLVSNFSLSIKAYYSGHTCEEGAYDGQDPAGHLHLVRSGSMNLVLPNGSQSTIREPTVVFLPRPIAHKLEPGAEGVELVCGTVDLGLNEQSPLALALPPVVLMPLRRIAGIGTTLDLLYSEAFGDEVGRQTALDRLFEYFIIQVLRHLIASGQVNGGALAAMSDTRLARAFHAMHEKPSHPWTVEELADQAGMSRARFASQFKTRAGVTPLEYLTNWRLAVARGQLRLGRPLKSVASAVGYQSPEALSRAFAKKVGKTPAEWIRTQNLK